MQTEMAPANVESAETQLEIIRALMLTASLRGAWFTLGEIGELTEFGEASISAQLRHLRKPCHGRYRVEKRRRQWGQAQTMQSSGPDGNVVWEYRVLPPTWGG